MLIWICTNNKISFGVRRDSLNPFYLNSWMKEKLSVPKKMKVCLYGNSSKWKFYVNTKKERSNLTEEHEYIIAVS